MIILFKILAILFNTLDYITTKIALKKYGMRELNPIAKYLMTIPFALAIVKLGLLNFVIIIQDYLVPIVFITVLFFLADLNNVIQILRTKRKIKNGLI